MRTFREYLKAMEYTAAGEVDARNNTDLGKPGVTGKWVGDRKKCGLGGLPCSKYVAQMRKR